MKGGGDSDFSHSDPNIAVGKGNEKGKGKGKGGGEGGGAIQTLQTLTLRLQ